MSKGSPQKCKMCDHVVKWNTQKKVWRIYCSRNCANLDKQAQLEKRSSTNMMKYGCINPMNNPQINTKRQTTMVSNYGVEYSGQSNEITDKRKHTMMEKHNVSHNWCTGVLRENHYTTMINKYGVKHPIQNKNILDRIKHTNIEKYGVKWTQQNIGIIQKRMDTNIQKYGVKNPLMNKEVYNKSKQTCLSKYGSHNLKQRHMINSLRLLEDKEWLEYQYIVLEKTALGISNDIMVDGNTVRRYLKKHNISVRYRQRGSYKCYCWLEALMNLHQIHIQHCRNGGEHKIKGPKNYRADGYCEATNTIYEFHGDRFHGNPALFDPTDQCHPFTHQLASELYSSTLEREAYIITQGYNLVVMWESDFNSVVESQVTS